MNMDERTLSSENRINARGPFPPALLDKLLSFGVLLVCSTLLTVLRCIELASDGKGSACAWLTALSVALMLLLSIRSRGHILPTFRHGLFSVTFGASMSAFLLLSATGLSIYTRLARLSPASEIGFIAFLMDCFALLTVAYFLVASATNLLAERKALHLLFCMAPIFFCALRVLNNFIIHSTRPLMDGGGYRILGMIFAMLFFLNEGKLLLGMKTASAYQFTGLAAAVFCASYDLPLLIHNITEGGGSWPDAAYSLLTLGLVAYILTRIATLPARKDWPME